MFEHAIEHYMADGDRDRKLTVLHCDQAIELIIKDKVRDSGASVFLKNGQTITYYDAIKLLEDKGLKIPEKPNLELMHDQRNVIQHKGAQVSQSDAEFYVQMSFDFIKRFMKEELNQNIENMINNQYLEIFNVKTAVLPISQNISEYPDISTMLMHSREFEVLAYMYLESKGQNTQQVFPISKLIQKLRTSGIKINVEDKYKIVHFFSLRNKIAHTDYVPTELEIKLLTRAIRKVNMKIKIKLGITDE